MVVEEEEDTVEDEDGEAEVTGERSLGGELEGFVVEEDEGVGEADVEDGEVEEDGESDVGEDDVNE